MALTGSQKAPEQPILEGADEAIREQIAADLRLCKEHETKRIEHGREETKYRKSAAALMEKYNIEDFSVGEGEQKVHGFFEQKKQLKVRTGEEKAAADDEEDY